MKKDLLHILINNLSKNEKRHIRIHAQEDPQNSTIYNCLILFDLYLKNKKVTFELFEQALDKKISQQQFKNYKTYLNDMILRNLEQYHKNSDIEIQLNSILSQVIILKKKGLNDNVIHLLKKSKKTDP